MAFTWLPNMENTMLHPFDYEVFAKHEIDQRLKEAEARHLAKLARGQQPGLSERALDSLGDLLIEAGTRLKTHDHASEVNGFRWAKE